MPDAQGRPFARDIAERIGIPVSDFRARVSRGHAPAPVDRIEAGGVLHAVWDPAVAEVYVRTREVRIVPGLPIQKTSRTLIDCPHTDCDASVRSWAEFNDHIRDEHRKVTA